MKKFKTNVFALVALVMMCISCNNKSSGNEDSYGPGENTTPTKNDEATNNTSEQETGPGSATIGDTLNKTATTDK